MESQQDQTARQTRSFFSSDNPAEVEGNAAIGNYNRVRRATLSRAAVRALALAIVCSFIILASNELVLIGRALLLPLLKPGHTWGEATKIISEIDIARAILARLHDTAYILTAALVFAACLLFSLWDALRHLKLLEYQAKLEAGNKRLHEMSLRDDLTGLYNQRALKEQLDIELERGRRHSSPVTLIMLDVDYYKNVNDKYGHIFGDHVLAQMATIVKMSLRKIDVVARYGGDEFVIILPETDERGALNVCQRIRKSIEDHPFALEDIRARVTISIGGATCAPDESVVKSELMRRADDALYAAKQRGRNMVWFWSAGSEPPQDLLAQQSHGKLEDLQKKIYSLSKEAREASVESIYALAAALEAKDGYTQRHSIGVMSVATAIARAMLLPENEVEQIRNAALLHDIGKIGIGEEILLKAGPLTDDERAIIRQHSIIGANILAPIRYLRDLVPMVKHHHEHYDGHGYPAGLKGDDIPLGARILAAADSFCAMTSDRPYSNAKTRDEANAEMLQKAGTQFDPKVVEALAQTLLVPSLD